MGLEAVLSRSAACVLAFSALAGSAAAQVTLDWLATPTAAQMDEAVLAAKVAPDARAVARCRPGPEGVLMDCRIVVDSPARGRAGEALKALLPLYRLNPGASTWPVLEGEVFVSIGNNASFDTPPELKDDGISIRYPPGAYAEAGGEALMSCLAGRMGKLYDCQVIAETPAGLGFGWKAYRIMPFLRAKPATQAGKPVPSNVTFPVHFPPLPAK